MKLDSFSYRLLWNIKNLLHFKGKGPLPIHYIEPCRNFDPPQEFLNTLDERKASDFETVSHELKILSQINALRLPSKLSVNDWQSLIKLPDARQRFDYLRFLQKRECKKGKDERKQKELKALNEQRRLKFLEEQREEESNSVDRQALLMCSGSYVDLMEKRLASRRILQAFQMPYEQPIIVVDCRWLNCHTSRGMNLAFKQIKSLLANNRDNARPWPIFLTNFPEEDGRVEEARKRHFSILDSESIFNAHITQQSYLELFPELREQQKIVYLSPHSKEPLETIDAGTCYIIGGIVDAFAEPGIPPKSSLETSINEEIQCRRLNLNYNLLKGGNPMFTLDQVLSILHEVFDSNMDWETTIRRFVPKRKFKAKSEKNLKMRTRFEEFNVRNKEIVRILQERTARKSMRNDEHQQRGQSSLSISKPVELQQARAFHTKATSFLLASGIQQRVRAFATQTPTSTKRQQPFDGSIRRQPTKADFEEREQKRHAKMLEFYFPISLEIASGTFTKIVIVAFAVDAAIFALVLWLDKKKDMDEDEKRTKLDFLFYLAMATNIAFCFMIRKNMKIVKEKS